MQFTFATFAVISLFPPQRTQSIRNNTKHFVKIKDAIKSLERAEAAGSGALVSLKYGLGLTGEAIAETAYRRALASVGSPNAAEANQLERILE